MLLFCIQASVCVLCMYTHMYDHFTAMSGEQNALLGKCIVLRHKRLGKFHIRTFSPLLKE